MERLWFAERSKCEIGASKNRKENRLWKSEHHGAQRGLEAIIPSSVFLGSSLCRRAPKIFL